MKIQIRSRFNGTVLFESDSETMGDTVGAAVKAKADLRGAYLRDADLRYADLRYADLSDADLRYADLSGAYLSGAYLRGADLRGADLSDADLSGAYLSDAYLSGAYLRDAYLRDAYLRDAYLRDADLSGAYLSDADLSDADLSGADLSGADLSGAKMARNQPAELLATRTILPEGDLICWKKLRAGIICKLKIPHDAKRVGGLLGRKCRAEFAVVLEGEGTSEHGGVYKVGETVKPDKYDPNPLVECSHGIHFFITREEAEAY